MKIHRCQRFYVPVLFYIYGEIGGYGSRRWESGWVGLNLLHVLKFIISCLFVWFVPPSSNISWGQRMWSTVSCDSTTEGSKTGSRPCHLSSRKVLTSTPCPTVSFLVSSNVGNNTQCSNSRRLLCFNKIIYRKTLKYELLFDIIHHYINLTLDNVLPLELGDTCKSHHMSLDPRENYNVSRETHLSPP